MTISIKTADDGLTGSLRWNGTDIVTIDGTGATVPNATASGHAVNLGQFPKALGVEGTQTLPSGLILKWGNATPTTTGVVVTFATAFPTGVNCITISQNDGAVVIMGSSSISISGFTAKASGNGYNAFWFAIGY